MKKYINETIKKMIAIALSCGFILSLLLGIMAVLEIKVYAEEEFQYTTYYKNVEDEYLDEATYEPKAKNYSAVAQITVFTHGLGGDASHWSNDGDGNFTYDANSMPEQLRKKLIDNGKNVTMMVVTPDYELKKQVGSIPEGVTNNSWCKSKELAQSRIITNTNDDNKGSNKLRNVYEDYKPDEGHRGIRLYECNVNPYPNTHSNDENINNYKESLTNTDVSKHIILIFEQWSMQVTIENEEKRVYIDESNDFVYSQLEYCLDAISYQYCQLTGELPTYNLIAHSRGGLTNMQYALAHPNNVASMYSVGTPYRGSAFGNFDLFLWIGGQYKNYTYADGSKDYAPGVLDITNPELTQSYREYWNTHYEEYYKDIDFNPLGSYVTAGFLLEAFSELLGGMEYEDLKNCFATIDTAKDTAFWGAAGAILVEAGEKLFWEFIKNYYLENKEELLENFEQGVENFIINNFDGEFEENLLEITNNFQTTLTNYEHLGTSAVMDFVIKDDLFIDLESQVANEYTGRNVKVYLMDNLDQIEGRNRKSVNNIGIAHNIEARHPEIVEYIVSRIQGTNYEQFSYRLEEEGYYVTHLNSLGDVVTTLEIPEKYKDRPVVGIDQLSYGVVLGEDESYYPGITKVIIPSSIKYIGDYAFYGRANLATIEIQGNQLQTIGAFAFANTNIANITLPSTVTQVGDFAFANCASLSSISLPNGLSHFGDATFANCTNLTSVNFNSNNNLTEIGVYTFYNCTALTSIAIPANVVNIREYAFSGCNHLSGVTFAENSQIAKINYRTFYNCTSLTEISIPESVESIESKAFYACSALEKVTFEGNLLTSIGANAFYGCSELTDFTMPTNVSEIGEGAFYGCSSLESIYIPTGVNHISASTFMNCTSLANVSFATRIIDLNEFTTIEANAFANCVELENIILPTTTERIEDNAFYGCTSLINCVIPECIEWIGEGAFSGCTNLSNLMNTDIGPTLGGGETADSAEPVLFSLPYELETIGKEAFKNCSKIEKLVLVKNLSYLGNSAFEGCTGLVQLDIISDSLGIASSAFKGCNGLTTVVIPQGVTTVGSNVFEDCNNLTIYTEYSNTPDDWESDWNTTNRPVFWDCEIEGLPYYVVSFNRSFGEQVGTLNTIQNPNNYNLTVPARYGSEFLGWYTTADCSGNSISMSEIVNTNSGRYYAKWNNAHSITFMDVGGLEFSGNTSKIQSTSYIEGIGAVLLNPTRSGYIFKGWYLDSDGTGDSINIISTLSDSDIIVYAKWEVLTNNNPSQGDNDIFENCLLITDTSNYQNSPYIDVELFNDVLFVTKTDVCDTLQNQASFSEYSSIVCLITDEEVFAEIQLLNVSDLSIPCIIASPLSCPSHDVILPTVTRDYYSVGYNIGREYLDSLEMDDIAIREIIQSMYLDFGYFPIVTGYGYKNSTLFLMGISDALGVPVKVLYETDIQSEFDAYDYADFSYWLFVEPSETCIGTFQSNVTCSTENFYIFTNENAATDAYSSITSHQYKITEKAEYMSMILVGIEEGSNYILDLNDIIFAEAPSSLYYDFNEDTIHSEYLGFWTSLDYGVSEDDWIIYNQTSSLIAWEDNSASDSSTSFDTYKMCRVEMIVVECIC